MTELIFLEDAYQKTFEAKIVGVGASGVVLDRTAFYPGGGGQPSDKGVLDTDDWSWKVVSVRRRDGEVWHQVEGDPPDTGMGVSGILDWERRYQLMRTHTAMHILCGVIWRDYGASVTGGNMEPLRGRMDFEFEHMRKDLVEEIEKSINAEVAEARTIQTRILPREEAFKIPDLIRTKIDLLPKGIQQVRVVEIIGLDLQADGGTHVGNTREVGPLRIVDYKSKGAINKRIVVALQV
ncbi:MAG TPA: alanyl-tRNA editing protein [Anaerolineae bacterium]|nr:alanyl-tRNA editing protein [Anaerolineae bacterium]